jgi:hypothetical protein
MLPARTIPADQVGRLALLLPPRLLDRCLVGEQVIRDLLPFRRRRVLAGWQGALAAARSPARRALPEVPIQPNNTVSPLTVVRIVLPSTRKTSPTLIVDEEVATLTKRPWLSRASREPTRRRLLLTLDRTLTTTSQ